MYICRVIVSQIYFKLLYGKNTIETHGIMKYDLLKGGLPNVAYQNGFLKGYLEHYFKKFIMCEKNYRMCIH